MRIFHFRAPRPGVRYSGEILFGDERITVFAGGEIARVLDPGDDYVALPPMRRGS
jgi:hypothetical protein